MLKISIVDSGAERRLVLEGALIPPSLMDLRTAWLRACAGRQGRKIVLVFGNVTEISARPAAAATSRTRRRSARRRPAGRPRSPPRSARGAAGPAVIRASPAGGRYRRGRFVWPWSQVASRESSVISPAARGTREGRNRGRNTPEPGLGLTFYGGAQEAARSVCEFRVNQDPAARKAAFTRNLKISRTQRSPPYAPIT